MGWSPAISSGDVVSIHAACIPTANGDGEILLFGGDNHDLNAALLGEGGDGDDIFNVAGVVDDCEIKRQPLVTRGKVNAIPG